MKKDLDGQIAEVKTHQKRLGAKYIGWRQGKFYKEFGFAKKGFEDRWVPLGNLRKGVYPFNVATIGEQEAEAKTYEKKLGAKYLGWKSIKGYSYFGFAKEGFEDRWTLLTCLRNGSNPFNVATIGEQEAEAKPYAEKLSAKYIGQRKVGNKDREFGFAKKGFEDRWITLSGLRRGDNPFFHSTLNEQEALAKSYQKIFGAKYIGWRKNRFGKHKEHKEFGFAKKGYEDRWVTLSNLRAGGDPFTKLTISEQDSEARPYAKKFGAKYIGWKRGKAYNFFGFAKKGFEDRWIPMGLLRSGGNPFNVPTIGEQEIKAKSHEKRLGAKYIGFKRGKNHNLFGFAKKGFQDYRWITLSHLYRGQNPFTVLTLGEQEAKAKSHEKRLGAKYIGWKQGKGTKKLFGFSKDGFEDRWTTLGDLNKNTNPFISGGFDTRKVGYFYIILVIVDGKKYIKLGITNNEKKRMRNHTDSLNKINGQWSHLHIMRFKNGQECHDLELSLIRQFKSMKVDLGINGFREECFHHSIKDDLFNEVLEHGPIQDVLPREKLTTIFQNLDLDQEKQLTKCKKVLNSAHGCSNLLIR